MPSDSPLDLFISHRSTERERVRPLVAAMEVRGVRVWLDERHIDDFTPDIRERIREGLGRCRALLALATAAWWQSRACQWELTAAAVAGEALGEGVTGRLLIVNLGGDLADVPDVLRRARIFSAETLDVEPLADAIAARLAKLDDRTLVSGMERPRPPHYLRLAFDAPRFIGRLGALWELHGTLEERGVAAVTGQIATERSVVRGMGGMGKTMLAREYASRFGAAWPGGVVVLNAKLSLTFQLTLLLTELERPIPKRPDVGTLAERDALYLVRLRVAVRSAMRTRVLWIVDDLPETPEPDDIDLWSCPTEAGATLITTRSSRWSRHIHTVELDVLPQSEARELLWKRTGRPWAALSDEARQQSDEVLRALGNQPLAVDIAGALLLQEGIRWVLQTASDPQRFDEQAEDLDEDLPTGCARSIRALLRVSISRLPEQGRDLLRAATLLASAAIPNTLVDAALTGLGWDERGSIQARRRLRSESLARVEGGFCDVHPIVRRAATLVCADEHRQEMLAEEMEHWLVLQIAPVARVATRHDEIQALLPHAEHLGGQLHEGTGRLPIWTAETYRLAGDYTRSKRLGTSLLAARRARFGLTHSDTLTAMNNLAGTLQAMGNYQESRALQEEVLTTRLAAAPEASDTLLSMNNLAQTLYAMGELKEAEELQSTALAAQRRDLPPGHPHLLSGMGNLALILQARGDRDAARELFETVLAFREKALGEGHPDTLRAMNNLAAHLHAAGDLSRAGAIEVAVLKVLTESLGEGHPDTLRAMNNLAQTVTTAGRYREGLALQEAALAGRRRVLGDLHPETLTSINNLGTILSRQGEFARARALQVEVLEVREQTLGIEHPMTLTAMSNLATTLWSLGDSAQARQLEETILRIRLASLGPEHPDTLTSMNNLASTLWSQGEFEAARALEESALRTCRQVLGPEHPNTLTSMNNLAQTLAGLGDLVGARKLQEPLLETQRCLFGPTHPHTLSSMNNLSQTLQALGEVESAHALLVEGLEQQRLLLGAEHPNTLATMQNLALVLSQRGELEEAYDIQNTVFAVRSRSLDPGHPVLLMSCWSLFVTLMRLDRPAPPDVLHPLLALAAADPSTLSSDALRDIHQLLQPLRGIKPG
ncbi:MAG: tetratricopeptide (TPR) repeat protein [Myxococcota bacterium]|jgi:tetratricopeptide (TPR) repeat protein